MTLFRRIEKSPWTRCRLAEIVNFVNVLLIILILGAGAVGIADTLVRMWVFIKRPRKKW